MKPLLIGKDPLAIEVHYQQMSSLMYNYVAHIPTVSGIDIALWDLAGKITNLPVSTLLGGPFRDSIPMYSHGFGLDMLDKASCRAWAARIKQLPEGFTVYKNNIHEILHVTSGVFADSWSGRQVGYTRFDCTGGKISVVLQSDAHLFTNDQVVTATPHILAGAENAIVVTAPTRAAAIPDVSSANEAGLPALQTVAWTALFMPKGTPHDILIKINADIQKVIKDPEFHKRFLEALVVQPLPGSLEAFAEYLHKDSVKWAKVINDAKIEKIR